MKLILYFAAGLIIWFLFAGLSLNQVVFASSPRSDSSVRLDSTLLNAVEGEATLKARAMQMNQGMNDSQRMQGNESIVWSVTAGGQSFDGSLQSMAFYPGVIAVNVNDTVLWTLGTLEPHTVSFLSGTQPPLPSSPESLTPVPCNTYNGTGVCSSGLLTIGQIYVLTFTEPGVYVYICEIHPGMQGVVVVRPVGTAYPESQLDGQPGLKLQYDLLALRDVVNRHQVTTTSGANGTLVFNVAAGVSTDEFVNVTLSPTQGANATGFATLNVTAPGTLQVIVNVTGLAPNSSHPEHIHLGSCDLGGPILYPLRQLNAGPDGTASSVTIINGSSTLLITSDGWYVNVHAGPTLAGNGSRPISCGNVVYRAGAYMRFIPEFLVVRPGDTVNWTNYAMQEIHTVTFLAAEIQIPDFPSEQAMNTFGNNTNYNGSGYYNSGVLLPGQSYSLTFTKPGVYTYLCLLHDEINMVGRIEVLPSTANTTTTAPIAGPANQPIAVNPVGAAIGSVGLIGIASTILIVTYRKHKRQN